MCVFLYIFVNYMFYTYCAIFKEILRLGVEITRPCELAEFERQPCHKEYSSKCKIMCSKHIWRKPLHWGAGKMVRVYRIISMWISRVLSTKTCSHRHSFFHILLLLYLLQNLPFCTYYRICPFLPITEFALSYFLFSGEQ